MIQFLSPWALLWLGTVPVLVWLWRLAVTRRRLRVASLVPFEHLLERQPRGRRRLAVNLLFWLQLTALLGLVLALAQPLVFQRRARTILAVLDTSASMAATGGGLLAGPPAFERAKQALLGRISRKAPTDQVLLITTAPVAPLLPNPTSDPVLLARAIQSLRVSHLGGTLATPVRLGRSLLAEEPDVILLVTDEPQPPPPGGAPPTAGPELPREVEWITVGAALPNVAIVGVDAQGPLCTPADARLIVTVQNFSDSATPVRLAAVHEGRRLTDVEDVFAPRERRSLSLALPQQADGWVEVSLSAPADHLEVDNRAWVDLRRHAALPIVVQASTPSFGRAVSSWLKACPALTWTENPASINGPALLITDQDLDDPAVGPRPPAVGPERVPDPAGGRDVAPRGAGVPGSQALPVGLHASAAAAALVFRLPAAATPVLSHWVASSDHPIGSYLAPVQVVAASLNLQPGAPLGEAVVSGLVDGRSVPIAVADERGDRRIVWMLLDPAGSVESMPVVVTFFNSLRWLMGSARAATTGELLTIAGFKPGTVTVRRPDGGADVVDTDGGVLQYDGTTVAGRYRAVQGTAEVTVAVNFFNPLESNLLDRPSTWRAGLRVTASAAIPRRAAHHLANLLILIVLAVLLLEWWRARALGPIPGGRA